MTDKLYTFMEREVNTIMMVVEMVEKVKVTMMALVNKKMMIKMMVSAEKVFS